MYKKGNKMNHTKPDFKEFLYKIAQWQNGLGVKPTHVILLYPWKRHFTALSPT